MRAVAASAHVRLLLGYTFGVGFHASEVWHSSEEKKKDLKWSATFCTKSRYKAIRLWCYLISRNFRVPLSPPPNLLRATPLGDATEREITPSATAACRSRVTRATSDPCSATDTRLAARRRLMKTKLKIHDNEEEQQHSLSALCQADPAKLRKPKTRWEVEYYITWTKTIKSGHIHYLIYSTWA